MKNAILISTILLVACSQATSSNPSKASPPEDNQIMCTQDAIQCADGSWVGRSPPNCDFKCPAAATDK